MDEGETIRYARADAEFCCKYFQAIYPPRKPTRRRRLAAWIRRQCRLNRACHNETSADGA